MFNRDSERDVIKPIVLRPIIHGLNDHVRLNRHSRDIQQLILSHNTKPCKCPDITKSSSALDYRPIPVLCSAIFG